MKAEHINPFISAATNVLKTMCQTDPSVGKPYVKDTRKTWGVVTGIIGMGGAGVAGNMVLSFDEPSILGIVTRMLCEPFKEINKDVVDAVGELTNMICGGAKAQLNEVGFSFEMATPVILLGKDTEISQLTSARTLVVPFTTQDGGFVIEANLKTR